MKTDNAIVFGRAVRGLGVSQGFTEIAWVRDQLNSKGKIVPYPGTFNLEVEDPDGLERLKKIRKGKGFEITPEDPSFCSAMCIPVVVEGSVNGLMVIPDVADYPISKVEIIASCNIKDTLSINDGDLVKLEITVPDE